ncbi:MAG: cohesin domain-containing protein [Euryarchaeota archaeon]|nr:cohesin domain-containing protein [Euryarchaeota archaeon]
MRLIVMAVAATLMVGLMILPAAVYADNGGNATVTVVPSSIDRSTGDEFSIKIVVDPDGAPVYGVQYGLIFDTTSLEFVSQTAGNFLSPDGADTIESTNKCDNESQKLEYGAARMGVETGVTEAGTLAQITFRVTGAYGSHLDLTDVIVSSPQAKEMPVMVESGLCLVDGRPPRRTIADVAIALQMIVRGEYSAQADANSDGKVTSLDALMIMQAEAKKEEM